MLYQQTISILGYNLLFEYDVKTFDSNNKIKYKHVWF